MKSYKWRNIIITTVPVILTMGIMYSCRKPYAPRIASASANYLVVEGVINTGQDSTIFNLSRTVQVSAKSDSTAEAGAVVTVESANNATYSLPEVSAGRYAAPPLGLDSTQQYRIKIKTADGKQYVSDFAQSKPTPSIDSVGFTMLNNGIQIYLNTHDPKNNTHYYRWEYQETWQFHSEYYSTYISDGKEINFRTPAQNIYFCFGSNNSTSLTVGSSAKLQTDLIYQQPIIFIESTSEKIETRYSILVKQYALTVDAFNYWQILKTNTEQLGSIFDAQPSEIASNIHCVSNPSEPVIGYISAGSVKQKRIYIDHSQLPDSWLPKYPYGNCSLDSELYCAPPFCTNQVAFYLIPKIKIPVSGLFSEGIGIGFAGSTTTCVDCTIRGTKTVPAFWEY